MIVARAWSAVSSSPPLLVSTTKKTKECPVMNNKKLSLVLAAAAAITLLPSQSAFAQKKYDTGASDTRSSSAMSRPIVDRLPPSITVALSEDF